MGKFLGNRLQPSEWIAALSWIVFWGALAYIAITERSVTLGGRYGISHFDGLAAVLFGFILLGASLAGASLLLRVHPYRRLLQALLFAGWLGGIVTYFAFVHA